MPLLQFKCPSGHVTERLVLSAAKAARIRSIRCADGDADTIFWSPCGYRATRVEYAQTGAPIFLGVGWTQKGNK